MAHTTVTLDGKVIVDDSLDHWQRRPPEALVELLRSAKGTNPPPWTKAMLMALTDAALKSQAVRISVVSNDPPAQRAGGVAGWSITVTPQA
jgi:hypothetical protein